MAAPEWAERIFAQDEIEIWQASLSQPPENFRLCKSTLSAAELDRFMSYGDLQAADNFVIRRGTLRHLLSEVLGLSPDKIGFDTDARGKPRVLAPGFEFSVSSSNELAVFAISTSVPVGIDIEWINPQFDYSSVVANCFTKLERQAMDLLDHHAFFEAWVKKEACAKAIGSSRDLSLANIEVMFSPVVEGSGSQLLTTRQIDTLAGYCAALAW